MYCRAYKDFEWHNQRNEPVEIKKGQYVDIINKFDLDKLMANGFVGPVEYSFDKKISYGNFSKPYARTKRIGIWLQTTTHYSGGRIHMYEYALCSAMLGSEIWLITNAFPMWRKDFPEHPNLRIALEGKDSVPPDLDLIVTDSKQQLGKKALRYKQEHPLVPFICFNFETPNWVAHFDKEYASKLSTPKDVFQHADYYIANSEPSKKYLMEWLGNPDKECGILPPAVNTYAVKQIEQNGAHINMPNRPYAVYSARPAKYKLGNLAIKAIWELDIPFDLVVFGTINRLPQDTHMHKIHMYQGRSDVEKYTLMKNAQMTLAPSKFEGYGMVPGESMSVGTPAVVFDLPVLRYAYGNDLIYVKWGDEKAYIEKVKEVAKTPKHKLINPAIKKKITREHGLSDMQSRIDNNLKYHAIKRKSISAHMICYWGFIPESIEAVYDYVDEINIAYGPTALTKNMGVKPDGSLEKIKAFPDPDNKIKLKIEDVWQNKLEMRNWCARNSGGNWHMLLDADEIWVGLDKWIESDFPFSAPRWVNFWHNENYWIYDSAKLCGRRWGKKVKPHGSVCPHYRWSWWRNSYKFIKHPVLADAEDRPLHLPDKIIVEGVPSCIIYHLGHALPKHTMKAKHDFYLKRDGADAGRIKRKDVWHNWNGKTGDFGDGIIEKVNWELPAIIQKAFRNLNDE